MLDLFVSTRRGEERERSVRQAGRGGGREGGRKKERGGRERERMDGGKETAAV